MSIKPATPSKQTTEEWNRLSKTLILEENKTEILNLNIILTREKTPKDKVFEKIVRRFFS